VSRLPYLAALTVCCTAMGAAASAVAADFADERMEIEGRTRRYLVHDFSNGNQTALVILLHGGGGNGQNAAEQTGFDRVAEREGLIAVYPYGSGELLDNVLLTWNAGNCCAYAMRERIDDVAFIAALIDRLIASRKVDPKRVYVTGLSNGGMMTHRLGRELPDRITAIAPVIASLFGGEPPARAPLPVMIVNGATDTVVKPEGGELGLRQRLGRRAADRAANAPTLPIASQLDYWAEADGCTRRTTENSAGYALTIASGCRDGSEVRHYVIADNGHAWPGGTAPRRAADPPVDSIEINELIWDFFRRFTRGSAPVSGAD
jgi:polyhydroxybutyrate depolymerase